MPGLPSHVAAGAAIALTAAPRCIPARRALLLGGLLGAVPDLDLIGRLFGVAPTACILGHRGLMHSLPFAVLVGGIAAYAVGSECRGRAKAGAILAFTLAIASHPLLDLLTATGPGVALASPFSCARTTVAWHPLDPATPAAHAAALPRKIWHYLRYELLFVMLPAVALIAWRWRARRSTP